MFVEVMCLKIRSVNFTGEVLMNGRIGFTLCLKVLNASYIEDMCVEDSTVM